MSQRLSPLFESGTFGCPICGSPSIELRDFSTHARTVYLAGMCHGVGEATAIHRWTIEMEMTMSSGMHVRVVPTHEDVDYPGRPPRRHEVIKPFDPKISSTNLPAMTRAQLLEHLDAIVNSVPKDARLEAELRASLIALDGSRRNDP